ncbi:efflux RND transporter periplasmic adaptor subunit [Ruegeria profundi]|uniref:efflux RND transporter periplasmic adaptor subunit n=1 Tax=Ruegeria profundi TaxID=1685378 RepID=UPI0009E85D15|nr:efflux RND transporter periplasmic adaptor subunit [Ruegeria profundi]
MHLNFLGTLAAIVCSAFPSVAAAQDTPATARPAKVFTVVKASSDFERIYPAIVYPSREVELSFRVSGRITELPIRASSNVVREGVVAQLDTRDFEVEVARLNSQLEEAEANLIVLRSGARPEEITALEASVQAAQAQRDQAREEYVRSAQLLERGVIPTAQYQQREAAFRLAEAELVSREEQLTIGRSGGRPEEIVAAEAAIRGLKTQIQSAKNDLSDATLRAPFDGTIAKRNVDNFRNVQAGETIALIQDLSTVDVSYDLPGADIIAMSSIGFDNVVSLVTFDSLPGVEMNADLVEFTTQADAATQTYRGRLSVTPPEDLVVLPGMVARVIIRADGQNDTHVVVPLSALAASPDGSPYVWLLDGSNNTVKRRPVELGEASEDFVFVKTGLEEGQMVVTAGLSELQEDMVVRPISKVGE